MSDLKHIDEIYKDWCGEHHTTNSCHPVHDSAEACDFAKYYHKVRIEANGENENNEKALPIADVSGCYSELDMREAFEAGVQYERSCEHYSKQPKVSKAGHIISNPTPDFSEFIHNYSNR